MQKSDLVILERAIAIVLEAEVIHNVLRERSGV